MGSASRRDASSLRRELFERPTRFEFFQALRLLHKLEPGRVAVGRDSDPAEEVVCLRSSTSFVFPTGDLSRIAPGEDGEPVEVTVNFMGVASPGSFGSLPVPYIQEVQRQTRAKNFALRDFLDLFNHRLVSLFYRAWERAHIAVLHDLGLANPFDSALRAIMGTEGAAFRDRLGIPDHALLSRAGLFAMSPAPASVVESLAESFFGIRAEVRQFVPTWYGVEARDQTRLGQRNATLGSDVVLGDRVCLTQARFRIRLGPMNWKRYQSLLPDREAFRAVANLVRLAVGPELDFEVQPVLDARDVPALRLESDPERPCRLGWSTWLAGDERSEDADDAFFTASLAEHHPQCLTEVRA